MKYCDLRPAVDAYRKGENVTTTLRKLLNEKSNTPQIIEIAYDLQAGSYADGIRKDDRFWRGRTAELSRILADHLSNGDRVLEVGTGEMTTLTGVANSCSRKDLIHYAMDISWSRIKRGRDFVAEKMRPEIVGSVHDFVGDFCHLPLSDKSMDLIWTSHSLEPNGGKEKQVLEELFRVARNRIILFEPSYENNSEAGRARMDTLGYIKGLPDVIADLGARLEGTWPLEIKGNPLVPTHVYVVTPPTKSSKRPFNEWACPATGLPLLRYGDCFWSEGSKLAYPIIGGIPVLRREAAVLATAISS